MERMTNDVVPYVDDLDQCIYHGDCLDVMPHLGRVDLVLTDLPYGMTDCKWDTTLPVERLWALWRNLLTPTGAVILTASQPFTSALVMSNPKAFRHEWIWEKNAGSNFGTVKRQPMKEHESVLVFADGRYHYEPIMQERAPAGLSRVQTVVNYATKAEVYEKGGLTGEASSHRPDLRYPRSIQRFNRERGLHPTQKPVALMEYLIRTYTNEGATVLDFTMGSGTTGVAAVNTNRNFIGMEKERNYFDIATRRIEEAQIQMPLLEVA
jgi:site-specific DNA-methyltransferase (adenine-specific)